MKVFVTGASGWIGSAVTDELVANGHEVVGLVRSDAAAERVRTAGAEPLLGGLDDLDSLRRGAEQAEAVVHLANKHDWSNPAESNRAERVAVETLVDVLAGSDRRFALASGTAFWPGKVVTENDAVPFSGPEAPRGGTEALALDAVDRGVHSIALRFAPTVHGEGGEHGFIPQIVAAARRNGVAGYVGDGSARWSAVHRRDAATAVRLALGAAPAGFRAHVVGEQEVATRDIAAAIAESLGLPTASVDPDDAAEHFGFIGAFWAIDMPASNAITRETLGWTPTSPTLIEDIAAGHYLHEA
ncbi:SDR family oxidoreductase [Schumannella luteola]|uniref:Nucleoside-diphosphate-sugar epimerase n=1 Tax=Schumannella luteola TaxID=472059 RepID=A0A852YQ99_9MICO|nr:SDR family oxidoreductase [Schumannella luteola]NYG99385.1 nucleoside-diphosphate-sugar epimerase [Schumannella luteola]TPX06111.1 SDR family oxidoreductase [Schumannella luteola]